MDDIVQTACRGVWQNMGQNCAGPERFLIYEGVYDKFCKGVTEVVKKMKTGSSLGDEFVDCGAVTMGPKQLLNYQKLVDDAVAKGKRSKTLLTVSSWFPRDTGAKVLAGGYIPKDPNDPLAKGSFYPPTILADVSEDAIIANDEIFGPIMCIFKIKGNSDAEAIRLANNCDYALSSCVFSKDASRASRMAKQICAGMSAVNDLEGCTYMSQSLPFGGCKKSGYDRFAGPEGLRGLCMIRSVCEDMIPAVRNSIPPPMHYPSTGVGQMFAQGLIHMFYSTSLMGNVNGMLMLAKYSMVKGKKKTE